MSAESSALRQLTDTVWQDRLSRNGFYKAVLGLPVDRIQSDSLEELHADVGVLRGFTQSLRTINPKLLGGDDRLTWDFLEHALQTGEQAETLWWTRFGIAPYTGATLMHLLQLVFMPFVFSDSADADRYLSLMRDYAATVKATTEKLRLQSARGWRLPKPALPGALAMIGGVAAAGDKIFPVDDARLKAVGDHSTFKRTVEYLLADKIRPAFRELLDYVRYEYAPVAPEGVGLAQYPNGLAAYRSWLGYHLTEDVAPLALHELGLAEVDEITRRMSALREKLGHRSGEDSFRQHLVDIGRLHASSADEVGRRFDDCMARIEPQISRFFSVLPKAPYGVQRLDPTSEAGMTYGYYRPPTGQGTRGYYLYNASSLDTRCQITAPAIIYHELAPGHHFHIARQQENSALPDIRRNAMQLSVFNEGWAEYAAEIAGEMGMYDDPIDRYGRLVHERFIAQRLVIDTGLNALGWSLDKARAYMKSNTLESDTQVATETLRYSTDLPGQSTAYRHGYLRFWKLRRQAEQTLGSDFDIKAFHEHILSAGALPLPVLDRHIERFITQ